MPGSKVVELRGGPLDGLRFRVASGINGTWLPVQVGTRVQLVEYCRSASLSAEMQEVWAHKPAVDQAPA